MQPSSNSGGNSQPSVYHVSGQHNGRGRGGKYHKNQSFVRTVNQNHMLNSYHEQVTLNHSLYYNMLEIFEQRNKILLTKYPSHFIEDVLRRVPISQTNYNFCKFHLNH